MLHGKLERVHRLIEEGYELEELDSDHGVVEARFRRRGSTVIISFAPHEAEALLMARPRR